MTQIWMICVRLRAVVDAAQVAIGAVDIRDNLQVTS